MMQERITRVVEAMEVLCSLFFLTPFLVIYKVFIGCGCLGSTKRGTRYCWSAAVSRRWPQKRVKSHISAAIQWSFALIQLHLPVF